MANGNSTVSVALQDQIGARLDKVRGICALASLLPNGVGLVPDDALPNAMWAARELLDEVEALVNKEAKGTEARHAGRD